MKKKPADFHFGIGHHIRLIETAVLNPIHYSDFLKNLTLTQSFLFFLINAFLWLLLSAGIRTLLLHKYHFFFSILSETLILIGAIFLLLLIFTNALQISAKIFGSRTRIKNNLKAVLFSTILLPFFAIPVFKVLAAIFSIYILIFNFKAINRFDRLKAVVPVIIIVGIFIFGLYSIGVININLITR